MSSNVPPKWLNPINWITIFSITFLSCIIPLISGFYKIKNQIKIDPKTNKKVYERTEKQKILIIVGFVLLGISIFSLGIGIFGLIRYNKTEFINISGKF